MAVARVSSPAPLSGGTCLAVAVDLRAHVLLGHPDVPALPVAAPVQRATSTPGELRFVIRAPDIGASLRLLADHLRHHAPTAGVGTAPGDAPAAWAHARRAALYARHGGVRSPASVAAFPLEESLRRTDSLRRDLLAVVAPLRARAHLLDSLQVYFLTNGDRRRTAILLGVHLRTIDHRFRQVTDLTEIDPRSLRGARTFSLSLLALELEQLDRRS